MNRKGKLSGSSSCSSTALTAVAFQDHLMRNLSLTSTPPKKLPNTKYKPPCKDKIKSTIDNRRAKPKALKNEEKVEEEVVLDPKPPPMTLAQKLGLVDAPAKLLTEDEWQSVKAASNERQDSSQPCVICKEEFGQADQVLLSCTHVFHKACIQAFERFSGRKTCPMCRREQYQTRIIHEGARNWRNTCATKIQATWRGYVVRCWYLKLRETVPPKDPKLRKTFYENKLQTITERMIRSVDLDVASFIHSLDQSLEASRDVFRSFDTKLAVISDDKWMEIELKAVERGELDCPICLTALDKNVAENTPRQESCSKNLNTSQSVKHATSFVQKQNKQSKEQSRQRKTVLLSCSHVFHDRCLQAFEMFAVGEHKFVCPVCRSHYQKKT